MTFPQALQYLESFVNYEKIPAWPYKESLKLERFKNFLDSIDNPQDRLRCIHVAGTKGKGSTCAFIAYILRQTGFKVGLYTSPHLKDFRERIRILRPLGSTPKIKNAFEGMISRNVFVRLVDKLKPFIEQSNRKSKYGPLSFFEVYTALAFVYFKEQKVDFAILETGLGGRLDATNMVNPSVSVITPISYEHTDKLGNTLTQIAAEKAGIIKNIRGLVVISAPQQKEAIKVIRTRCKIQRVGLYEVGRDIVYKQTKATFTVRGLFANYPGLKIRLSGRHQLTNAATAVGVVEALRLHDINVSIDSIRDGLYNTVWPGRCEVIARNPLVVLDGAQNVASAKAIKKTIQDNFRYKKLILVLGISCDKDKKGICRELCGLADKIILTQAYNPRATESQELARYFPGKEIHITTSVKDAKKMACQIAKRDDLILVCGSLFVVGEFRDDKIRLE
jgi:dihydrofolate synthase/folylpolyglutamate synthase